MQINSVTISGFGPFISEKKFNFNNRVNIISGHNGSGKTSVVDSIVWGIFGPTALSEKLKGDRHGVVNNSSARASVELDITNGSGDSITILRTLSSKTHKLSMSKNGTAITGKLTDVQKEIDKELNLTSRESYISVSSISSSPVLPVSPFISGSLSDRRKILSSLVDPTQYNEKRNKQVRIDIKNLKKDIASQNGRIEAIKASIEEKKSSVPDLSNLGIAELKAKLSTINVSIEELRSSSGSEEFNIVGEAQSKIDKMNNDKESFLEKKKDVENEISALESQLDKLNSKVDNLYDEKSKSHEFFTNYSMMQELYTLLSKEQEVELDEISDSIKSLREQSISDSVSLRLIQQTQDGGECPICKSEIDDESEEIHDHIEQAKSKAEVSGEKYEDTLLKEASIRKYSIMVRDDMEKKNKNSFSMKKTSVIEDEIKNTEEKISDIQNSLNIKNAWIRKCNFVVNEDIPKKIAEQTKIISDVESNGSIEAGMNSLKSLNSEKDSLLEELDKASKTEAIADSMIDDIGKQQESLDEEIDTYNDMNKRMSKLEEEKEKTGVNGDISSLISDACKDLSSRTTQIFTDIFSNYNGWLIEFVSEKSSDIDDEEEKEQILQVNVNDSDLSIYSHGEQMRVIIAVSIALSEFYNDKFGTWPVPLWDEPTIAIDGSFNDIISDVVDNYSNEKQFIICSRLDDEEKSVISHKSPIIDMDES